MTAADPGTQTSKPIAAKPHRVAPPGSAADNLLSRLQGVKRVKRGWMAQCPAHEDKQGSLSIAVGRDGQVLLKCFAGCEVEAIVRALGLDLRDLFEQRGGGGSGIPPKSRATVQPPPDGSGLTLQQYADAKRLPTDFLRAIGLSEIRFEGRPVLRMPYLNEAGSEVAVRFRLAFDGENRFRWRSGAKPCLYGLQRLNDAREAGHVVLVEGESDAQVLWLHGIPALGVPGANTWREEWAVHLDGIPLIYAVVEPDQGGEATLKWLAASSIRERVRLVALGEAKDPSGLFLADSENFAEAFGAALEAAVPWAEHLRAAVDERTKLVWEKCKGLAHERRILDRFADELAASGVAGERKAAKLLYLVLTSRLLERLISAAIKGPSSAGKSYLVERVLRFFPPSAYYALSAMSERALAYDTEPLSHRYLVLYEAVALQGDFASYLVRSLLSEGHVRYVTVEKTSKGLAPRLIEREGPTGLVVTTTAISLHPENETRLLSIPVTDTAEQTREVLLALAEDADETSDRSEWLALQEWLEASEHRVFIPFAPALAESVPPIAVRLRRDFGAVLYLIRAHAVLHQASRQKDSRGRIVASTDDYAVVRELVADLVAEGAEAAVPETVRQTVHAVTDLLTEHPEGVTAAALGRELRIDKASAWRRARAAIDRGFLKNQESTRGRPGRLVLDEAMPEEVEVLPPPEKLSGCTVAEDSGGIDTPLPPWLQSELSAWPETQREAFDERLAIMMVEGGLLAEEAARQAAECVRREFGL